MDIDRYLADNESAWVQLHRLNRSARSRPARLNEAELELFIELYLQASVALSFVRTYHPEPLLIQRLTALVGESRNLLEGRRSLGARNVGRFFTVGFPVVVWQLRRFAAVSALLTFLPAVLIALWISRSPAALEATAPPALRDAYVQEDFEAYYSDRPASQFATEVTVNNIRVSVLAFAGGMLAGLGTVAILVFNGANIGFAAGLFAAAGEQPRFYGLILPHGLLELTAVVLAGAAGLSLGWAMIAPGDQSRAEAVLTAAQRCLTVIMGLIVAFVAAGLIEGFVTGSTLSTALRVGLGVSVELSFLSYLYIFGRRGAAVRAEGSDWSSDLDASTA